MTLRAEYRREQIDAELDEHRKSEWCETGKYGVEILLRFHGRHWMDVNRERLRRKAAA